VATEDIAGGGQKVYLPGIAHCGANFAVGDWVLTSTLDGASVVGCLTAAFAIDDIGGETSGYFVEAQTWPASILQRQDDHMLLAPLQSFTSGHTTTTFPITTALKPVFVVQFEGTDLLSFVEVP
jgi:hypothetical protein